MEDEGRGVWKKYNAAYKKKEEAERYGRDDQVEGNKGCSEAEGP